MDGDLKRPGLREVIIIGGGPAGLTAAYELCKQGERPTVLEMRDRVGGISRTETYKGYYFDMGGHRFFTKVKEVSRMWQEVLGDDFLLRPRLSRIYYNRKFFHYPLKPLNALRNLGFWKSLAAGLSYGRWRLFPYRQVDTFEEWVTNRFGKRLFLTFFKTYTEKVWGISTSELKADWAAQRIKDLSLKTAIFSMFVKPTRQITTLIEAFHYPRLGPGMMWNAVKEKVEQQGGRVWLHTEVLQIQRRGNRIERVVVERQGERESLSGTDFISSMPVADFIKRLDPPPPQVVLEAASALKYRDFLTVCLIVNQPELFLDNWIYVHDPTVKVGRIQNFKNWSPSMVPEPGKSSLGLEYFCTEGDETWTMDDAALIELGKREVAWIGLAAYADIEDGAVFRVAKSYPIYNSDYRANLEQIQAYINTLENFQTIGRNGLHRYNNQDHSMLTAMLAVRNLLYGEQHDLWSVNTEQDYHEQVDEAVESALQTVFLRLDSVAFGLSLGVVAGLVLLLMTLALVWQGGAAASALALLGQYLPGYRVSLSGSVLGLLYGFVGGACFGWAFACLRNTLMILSLIGVRRAVQPQALLQLLDYV